MKYFNEMATKLDPKSKKNLEGLSRDKKTMRKSKVMTRKRCKETADSCQGQTVDRVISRGNNSKEIETPSVKQRKLTEKGKVSNNEEGRIVIHNDGKIIKKDNNAFLKTRSGTSYPLRTVEYSGQGSIDHVSKQNKIVSTDLESQVKVGQHFGDGFSLSVNAGDLEMFKDDIEELPQDVLSDDSSDEEDTEDSVKIKRMTNKEKEEYEKWERKEGYKKLLVDPEFREVFQQMWKENLQAEKNKEGNTGRFNCEVPNGNVDQANDLNELNKNDNRTQGKQSHVRTIKLPSDSTLYTPALKRVMNQEVIDGISDFTETIRIETAMTSAKDNQPEVVPKEQANIQSLEGARNCAQQSILEAEKFKATINPPGIVYDGAINQYQVNSTSQDFGVNLDLQPQTSQGLSDDDFFHLTCHIDPNLREKIEKGEFVDLEKLLPKDKILKRFSDKTRLEWVNRDGGTFLVPASDRDHKINGICRWDQAFRVYVTIYCGANPHRSKEIWQYISVINTAAASYCWDNVASYYYTFRHLMEFNPNRSWATTYNQMWNLSMKDPLPRNTGNNGQKYSNNGFGKSFSRSSHGSMNGLGGHTSQLISNNLKGKKPTYCWNFNKGVPCKYGKKCRFIKRCSYCDSPEHALLSCPKLVGKPTT